MSSAALWLGLGLLLIVAGLVLAWRRHAAPAAQQRRRGGDRRRNDRERARGVSHFASTQLDSVQDTQLDSRMPDPVRRIGRYLIERDIGRGAMGMVLLARDERNGEAVAIKTMALGREFHGEALDEARERFFREAETAGRLQHPDIVAIRETGEQDGTAFIAMELLGGHDLSVDAQPARLLPVSVVVAIGARVARALAYAHRQGVTHRDIKPANIMVEPASGMVKVTDFGIARIIDSTQTRTGLVLGTPSFMSPEQMAGARTDGRSDLYALGVTLFQLLTGSLPHRADSMAALLHSIGNDTAPDVRTLRPELPQALADIVALALEKRPEVRYADGDAMAADLAAVLALLEDESAQTAAAQGHLQAAEPQASPGAAAPP
ncbi:serine/threonine-protein kinase [Methylibium sp.]|uniref:serine/threonine-protein kinase n=1 Tax=Methylibium sp. TaxID=2067992 RepID=UPI0017B92288|nr:serine/threonine-protein kinase [Methylibium sp.]MBA3589053.1 serine/threonine protein kinase [Methylibium sp.]